MKSVVLSYGLLVLIGLHPQVYADDRDGDSVYKADCASCRDSNTPRTPTFSVLTKLQTGRIVGELVSGEVLWDARPVSCEGCKYCSPAQGAAVTALPGVVFSGSQSGEMRTFDSATGAEIWRFDTVRDFDTVNGAKGRGGSIDQAGTVIVDGMVYFNSGYSKWGKNPGNVVLSFGLPDK